MKIPGAPRVAHRVGRYVASADRRRGQLQHLFNPPVVSLSLGVKLFRQAEPLLFAESTQELKLRRPAMAAVDEAAVVVGLAG